MTPIIMTIKRIPVTIRDLTPEQIYREAAEIRARDGLPPVEVPPSLLAMAGNLVGAVVAHVGDGGRKASDEVQAERLAICESCPYLSQENGSCMKCGCSNMNLKRSWASSSCPLPEPKWSPV